MWAQETMELRLQRSKTGYTRYINIAGETANTRLKLARALFAYWKLANIETSMAEEGHLNVERPKLWVVKLTMLGMSDIDVEELIKWLGESKRSTGVQNHAKQSIKFTKVRYTLHWACKQNSIWTLQAGKEGARRFKKRSSKRRTL